MVKLEDINPKEYEDIINLPHYEPSYKHPRMNIYNRSAIFAPFAALTGYENEINETSRLTFEKIELEEDFKEQINNILNNITSKNKIKITYFLKDLTKDGGKYIEKICTIKKIDYIKRELYLEDKEKILIDNIKKIEVIE